MKLKLNVGQIFLTHPQDENFVSVYEETFSKQGVSVDLFAILEIADARSQNRQQRKTDYENLAPLIVGALKKTYISAELVNTDTFEKALANINAALARAGARGKAAYMSGLSAVVAAVCNGELSLSAAGSGLAMLEREGQILQLSEGLAGEKLKPAKILANFTSGSLAGADRVIFSNRELLNYLALDRVREILAEETLEDACAELIGLLSDVRDRGFGAYVFEVYEGDKPSASGAASLGIFKKLAPARGASRAAKIKSFLEIARYITLSIGSFLWRGIRGTAKFIVHFFRARPKKYLIAAMAVVVLLFFGSIALASYRRSWGQSKQQEVSLVSQIDAKLNEAEAALIYKDENKTTALVGDAEKLLKNLAAGNAEKQKLTERLLSIKGKVNREIQIDNPTALAQFAAVPDEIVYSPNGFLGFNRNTGRMSFYDFRAGSVRPILENQNTGSLGEALYLGASYGYVFFDKDGAVKKLNLDNGNLSAINTAASPDVSISDLARAKSIRNLGEDAGARLYALDTRVNQIWRLKVGSSDIAAPEKWLKNPAELADARAMAVDGSVYVLYADHADKYFNGAKQDFRLSPAAPALEDARKIFTRADYQNLYILDPENRRILVYSKTGLLAKQFTSPKFRDLSDVYVDEKSGLMYVLAGSELLQINLK